MATLVMTFDSSTGKIFVQKVGSDQIANQAITSAHIGAGIIGGAHFNPNDVWPAGRIFSGGLVTFRGYNEETAVTITDAGADPLALHGTEFENFVELGMYNASGLFGGWFGVLSGGAPYIEASSGRIVRIIYSPFEPIELAPLEASLVNGVNISGHTHTGGANDAPKILSGGIGSGHVGAIHVYPFTSGYVVIGQGSGVTPVYGGVPAGTPGDNTITSAKIASGQVGDGHIYPASILSGKIGANIIATPHILNQGILSASIGTGVLAGVHIVAGGITSANYASGSINGVMIANASILSSDVGANVIGPPLFERFASGQIMKGQGTGANAVYKDEMAAIAFVIDGFGSSIQSGNKGYLQIPFPCTLNSVTLLGNQSGQIDVHIWRDSYANYPPTSGDTICSNFLPRISGSFKYQETSLSGWNRSISSGDILDFVVTPTATSIQLCTVSLGVYK